MKDDEQTNKVIVEIQQQQKQLVIYAQSEMENNVAKLDTKQSSSIDRIEIEQKPLVDINLGSEHDLDDCIHQRGPKHGAEKASLLTPIEEERQQQLYAASNTQTANLPDQLEKELNERQGHILERGRQLLSDLIIKAVPIESSKSTYVEWQLLSTYQPTSASSKTDESPGEVNDFNNTNNGQTHTYNDQQYQQNDCSLSSLIPPQHKSKQTCLKTKEISCTTDDGFWIQKQYYNELDDTSKELFDSLMDKLEKIRIANEENAAKKQQHLVERTRSNKSSVFNSTISLSTITQSNDEKDLTIKLTEDEQNNKVEESTTNNDEKKNQ
ncbi:unnamed protein product [Rotaria sordida]|uniref:Uncharacterized protein n=1 Tax=Rotaria sordida TaxID=392033 RepID=A0A818Z7A9_9BILA|nr:unnamed protein product [Rotaria sordida]